MCQKRPVNWSTITYSVLVMWRDTKIVYAGLHIPLRIKPFSGLDGCGVHCIYLLNIDSQCVPATKKLGIIVANSKWCASAKNYENWLSVTKVIAKIKRVSFSRSLKCRAGSWLTQASLTRPQSYDWTET